MRAFFAWVIMATVSVGLGLALYATSLAGSTTAYHEAPFTPGPTSTVVKTKTKTKIVRKPAKTRVVYVAQTAPAPAAPQQVYTGSSSGSTDSGASTKRVASGTSSNAGSSHDQGSDDSHDD